MNPHKDRVKMFFHIIEQKRFSLVLRTMRKARFVSRIFLGTVALTLFAFPGLYAATGFQSAVRALLVGLLAFLIATLYTGALRGAVMGTAVGYLGGIGYKYIHDSLLYETNVTVGFIKVLIALALLCACLSLGLGLITSRKTWSFLKEEDDFYHFPQRLSPINLIINYVIWAVLLSLLAYVVTIYSYGWVLSIDAILSAVYVGAFLAASFFCPMAGFALGTYVGLLIRERLNPTVLVASKVIPYLEEMIVPTIGFLLGYGVIVFLFANFYWAIWLHNPSSFSNVPASSSLGAFLYFSMITIATVGYGDITPTSSLARTLVSAEIVIGLAWVTIVFAALIAYLQPRFGEIIKRQQPVEVGLVNHTKKSPKRQKR